MLTKAPPHPDHVPVCAPSPAADVDTVVEARGLVKRYGCVQAVHGLDLQVRAGEIVGMLGPNGAGKTSTLEVLAGLRQRDAGYVRVLGLDPGERRDLRVLRRLAGVVPQQGGHYRYLSVRETIDMHRGFHAAPRSVDELLELTGLGEVAHLRVRQLSGGQQRRLDVGVALVGRPQLVLLDEPTTGFDPAARRRAWTMISGLRDIGTTVLLTTHYMEEAQALADRLVVLQHGRVVGQGTPGDLARELCLGSTVSFTLPDGVELAQLPAQTAPARLEGRFVRLSCTDPTTALSALCGWALARGVRLDDLEVRAPSLEESYLALTDPPHAAHGEGEPAEGAVPW